MGYSDIDTGVANKALTGQQIVIGLLCLPVFFAVLMFVVGAPASVKTIAAVGGGICAVIIVLMLVWHNKKHNQPDSQPDVLAMLFPENELRQIGDTHFVITTQKSPNGAKFTVIVQNVLESKTFFTLSLNPREGKSALAAWPAKLQMELPSAAVGVAQVIVPFAAVSSPTELILELDVSGKGSGGKKCRFARRTVPIRKVGGGMQAFALTAGVRYGGGGTFYGFDVTPSSAQRPPASDQEAAWTTRNMWTIGGPKDAKSIRELFSPVVKSR
jgi:hypothetical protein